MKHSSFARRHETSCRSIHYPRMSASFYRASLPSISSLQLLNTSRKDLCLAHFFDSHKSSFVTSREHQEKEFPHCQPYVPSYVIARQFHPEREECDVSVGNVLFVFRQQREKEGKVRVRGIRKLMRCDQSIPSSILSTVTGE